MLKLSKKSDYGLIAVKHLATHGLEAAQSASDIAEMYGISSTLLAKVLQKLARIIGLLLAFCWAHVRRDFLTLARSYPDTEAWAMGWVQRIGTLYHLNEARLAVRDNPVSFAEPDRQLRAHLEQMAVDRDAQLSDASLRRAARKVLVSLQNHWEGLTG